MSQPFIPYSRQSIDQSDVDAVVAAMKDDFITQGPRIDAFERAVADLHDCAHGVAVCNATAALHIACLALDVGPGDLVWTSPNTFVASANCARYCGADVDFVDIDPETRNMSLAALEAKLASAKAAGRLPKVVIPIDFSGLPCPMPEIAALAAEYGFRIIEDASHALGASIDGTMVGSRWADITVLSFHAVKIITSAEGGMLITQDEGLADRLRLLRSHGITRDTDLMENESDGPFYYEQVTLGYNYRITDLQAALGTSQLARLPARHAEREARAKRYDEILADLPLKLTPRIAGHVSAHHLYVVEILDEKTDRRALFEHLRESGIGANVHYIPVHIQPDYTRLGFARGDFPAAETYYDRCITIPLYPEMSDADQDRVAAALKSGLAAAR